MERKTECRYMISSAKTWAWKEQWKAKPNLAKARPSKLRQVIITSQWEFLRKKVRNMWRAVTEKWDPENISKKDKRKGKREEVMEAFKKTPMTFSFYCDLWTRIQRPWSAMAEPLGNVMLMKRQKKRSWLSRHEASMTKESTRHH